MSRKTFAVVLCAIVGFCATAAVAQPTIAFGTEPAPIGLSDCADRLNDVIALTGDVTLGSGQQFEMFLVMFAGETDADPSSCLDSESFRDAANAPKCPVSVLETTSACACIQASGVMGKTDANMDTVSELTTSFTLSNLKQSLAAQEDRDKWDAFFCDKDQTVSFRADVRGVEPAEGDTSVKAEDVQSDPISIVIDITPPPALSGDPIVTPAESALVVQIGGADRGIADVDAHEVCVRLAGTAQGDQEPVDPSDGFAATACKRTTVLKNGDEYRYENLENDVQYELVIVALDAAGNRSENSTIITASPTDLMDFAELYTARLGGAVGETGGCNAFGESTTNWFVCLLLVGGVCIRRRPCK